MEFVANFELNNNNLDASFDLSEGASFDALFEIYAGSVTWGNILGDITNQTDLQDALNSKASNERVDGIVEVFDNDIESINDSITELSENLDDLESTVTDNYNELNSAIDSNHQAISNINNTIQSYGDIVSYDAADFATSAQGALADTALQPNDNISELTNDVGYITSASLPVVNNNRITIQKNGSPVGDFTLNQASDETININVPTTAADVGALPDTTTINDLTTTAQQEALNSGANTTNIGQISANAQAIQTETTNRENADNNLQSQIDAITAASDVTDIVGTYAELQAYDTTSLPNNSIIKVLQDESRDDETTYYRWVITGGVGAWVLIGEEGPYYTKSEADSTFVPQTRTVNGKALSSNINLDASDVGALPDSTVIPTVNNATLTIQKNGANVQTFTANASSDVTANITVPTDTSDLTNGAGFITAASLPTVNDGTLTIQANGTTVGTFTANQSGNTTANIVVPDSATWGNITGTLSNQTDLQNALNSKADSSSIGNGTVTFTQGGVTKGTITMNQSGNTTIAFEQGSSGTITDVEVNGESVVSGGVAEIDLSGYQEKLTAGTDLEIIKGSSVHNLPDGYTEVEYIQASGNAGILTSVAGNINTNVTLIANCTQILPTSQVIISDGYNGNVGTYFGQPASKSTWGAGANDSQFTSLSVLMKTEFNISSTITSTFALSGTVTQGSTIQTFSRAGTVPVLSNYTNWSLFGSISKTTNTIAFPTYGKVFYAKFEQNNTVVAEYIPAIRNSDNAVGLYDIINDTFIGKNLGPGTLIAGEEVVETTTINFTNDSGYITGINSTDVTDALGYTPVNPSSLATVATTGSYNDLADKPYIPSGVIVDQTFDPTSQNAQSGVAINGAGFLTGITSSDVTTALGYTPYNASNPNGYTSNVGTVTSINGTQPDGNGNVAITIPTVNNGTLTITQDGTTLGTFGANQSGNSTIPVKGLYDYNVVNANIIGTPTINGFVMSDFSTSDYAIRTETLNFGVNPWELWIEFTTGTIRSIQNIFYGGANKLSIYLDSTSPGALVVVLGNTTTALDVLSANTTYKVRIVTLADKDLNATSNTNVYIYDENDSLLWSHSISSTVSQVRDFYFGVGYAKYSNTTVAPFSGSINFENTYINQINTNAQTTTRVWSGIVPVLDSKANTDFSNITDTAKISIAHLGMPSDTYVDVTVGASGAQYLAPADGWIRTTGEATANFQYIKLVGNVGGAVYSTQSTGGNTQYPACVIPVRKGSTYQLDYSTRNMTMRFIYAVGSESEV